MLRLKGVNNESNTYCTCQSLFNFLKLSIQVSSKEPLRILNKLNQYHRKNCLDCKLYLNVEVSGHRASSTNCRVNNNNWRFITW